MGFANAFYFRLVQRAGASSATSVTFLIPAFAATWAHLFLGETITVELAFGGALILAGCAMATGLLPMRPVLDLFRRLRERQDAGL
jgi:drug/metabolite transporter (DMT)-like permease